MTYILKGYSDVELELPPAMMTPNMRGDVETLLKRDYVGSYTARDGLTIDVIGLIDIIDSRISMADGRTRVTARYEREYFKPVAGTVTRGAISKIVPEGVFVKMRGFQTFVKDGRFAADEMTYDNCSCVAKVGDVSESVIANAQFRRGTLYCVSTHKCVS